MMKEAYFKSAGDVYGWCYEKVELTGNCKTVTGGPFGKQKYYEVQRRLFGYKLFKSWFSEHNIVFFDPVVETFHKCECVK